MEMNQNAAARQAISDYGPVLGLTLGRPGKVLGSFQRLQDSLAAITRDPDPVLRTLAVEALAAWNAREEKNVIPGWDDQHPKQFAELTRSARTRLEALYRALEFQ